MAPLLTLIEVLQHLVEFPEAQFRHEKWAQQMTLRRAGNILAVYDDKQGVSMPYEPSNYFDPLFLWVSDTTASVMPDPGSASTTTEPTAKSSGDGPSPVDPPPLGGA